MRSITVVLTIAIALTLAASVHGQEAAPTTDVWSERPLALEAHAGLGTPYGLGGLALDYTPIRWLSLNAGAGAGMDGLQTALMLRARYPFGRLAPTVSGGISYGDFKEYGGFFHDVQHTVDGAMWAKVDLGLESRWSGGVRVRAYGGLGQTLTAADCRAEDDTDKSVSCSGEGIEIFYGGLALGYGF